jgi:23S rRNA (pseudouridine1915-N3)-methyltransferase
MKIWIQEGQYPENGITIKLLWEMARSAIRRLGCAILLAMELTLASIGSPLAANDPYCELTRRYLKRTSPFAECRDQSFRSEELMFQWIARRKNRAAPTIVLLDSRGRTFTSEAFAGWMGTRRDSGAQHLIFGVGSADGWSENALRQANLQLSLGPMTLAHALAQLVLAEQIYRAFTILSGHPYHTGH